MRNFSRDDLINTGLREYYRLFQPLYVSLLFNGVLLDMGDRVKRSLKEKSFVEDFNQESLQRICMEFVSMSVDSFKNAHFKNNKLNFNSESGDDYSILKWSLTGGAVGNKIDERSGAIVKKLFPEYTALAIFSYDSFDESFNRTYESELEGINKYLNF